VETMLLKCSSVRPKAKNPRLIVASKMLPILEVNCLGKITKSEKITMANVKIVTGLLMLSINVLMGCIL
jgi:hypothetical protein